MFLISASVLEDVFRDEADVIKARGRSPRCTEHGHCCWDVSPYSSLFSSLQGIKGDVGISGEQGIPGPPVPYFIPVGLGRSSAVFSGASLGHDALSDNLGDEHWGDGSFWWSLSMPSQGPRGLRGYPGMVGPKGEPVSTPENRLKRADTFVTILAHFNLRP